MSTPEDQSPEPPQPVGGAEFADRVYRSHMGIASGVALLAIVGWLCVDAIVAGEGRTPWLALAALILLVPLTVAFTLRPAVYAGQDQLRLRNPFRVITLPWGQVAALRSGYSNEVLTRSGAKYQLWAIPVSLRRRKAAARQETRAAAARTAEREGRSDHAGRGGRGGLSGRGISGLGGSSGPGGFGGFGSSSRLGGVGGSSGPVSQGPVRAGSDQAMDDVRELWESREKAESAQGEITVRWAWEILGPVAAGAAVLGILLAVG